MSFELGDNVIDSRDVEGRIEELQDDRQDLLNDKEEAQLARDAALVEWNEAVVAFDAGETWVSADEVQQRQQKYDDACLEFSEAEAALAEWEAENLEELDKLTKFRDVVGHSEWNHGLTLIHESHWVDYVQQLVSDIGDMPQEIPSYIVIDWEATANNINQDYSEVEVDGHTYKFRS